MLSLERLFSVVDETEHVYTWDYITREVAVDLFDVNDEYFAMVTARREIEDETGAMGDYREISYYIWNLYLKSTIGTEPIEKYDAFGIENLVNKMREKPWGSGIKKVASITLGVGKIYISNSDLVLERKKVKENG